VRVDAEHDVAEVLEWIDVVEVASQIDELLPGSAAFFWDGSA
jgi:hypothetical protein